MEAFYMGFFGAITGGFIMVFSLIFVYIYDRRKTDKLAQKLTNDIKSVYTERLMNTRSNIKTSGTIN